MVKKLTSWLMVLLQMISALALSQASVYSADSLSNDLTGGEIQSLEYGLWIKEIFSSTTGYQVGSDIIPTSDGGYAVVGSSYDAYNNGMDMFLYRVDYRGVPKANFGTNGFVRFGGYAQDSAYAVEQTPDGGFIVAGNTVSTGNWDILVAKITATGTFDKTFGTNGLATYGTTGTELVSDIFVDTKNYAETKYVLVGSTASSTGTSTLSKIENEIESPGPIGDDFLVVRLLSNGRLDNTFVGNGVVKYGSIGTERANWGDITNNGKYVIGGYTTSFGGSNDKGVVIRLNGNGSADNSFGTNGVSVVKPSGTISYNVKSGFAANDGGVVMVGSYLASTNNTDYLVTKLKSNGQLDATFGQNGTVMAGTATYDFPASIIRRSDGGFVIGGRTGIDQFVGDMYLVAFNSNGSLDTKFGKDGFRKMVIEGDDYISKINQDANGNILLTGNATQGTSTAVAYGKLNYRGNMAGCSACSGSGGSVSYPSGITVIGGGSYSSATLVSKTPSIGMHPKSMAYATVCSGVEIPKPLFPINGQRASSTPVTVSWNKIIAPKYQITVKGPGVWWKSVPLNGSLGSYKLSNLKLWKNQTYTWKVRACWNWTTMDCTQASPWSYEESFVYNPVVVE